MTFFRYPIKQCVNITGVAHNWVSAFSTASLLVLSMGCIKHGAAQVQQENSQLSIPDENVVYILRGKHLERVVKQSKTLDDTTYLSSDAVLESVTQRIEQSTLHGITIQVEAVLLNRMVDILRVSSTGVERAEEFVTLVFSVVYNPNEVSDSSIRHAFSSVSRNEDLARFVTYSSVDGSDVYLKPLPKIQPSTLMTDSNGGSRLRSVSGFERARPFLALQIEEDSCAAVFSIVMKAFDGSVSIGEELELSLDPEKVTRWFNRLGRVQPALEESDVLCVSSVLPVLDCKYTTITNVPPELAARWP